MKTYYLPLTQEVSSINFSEFVRVEVITGEVCFNFKGYGNEYYTINKILEVGGWELDGTLNLFSLKGNSVVKISHK